MMEEKNEITISLDYFNALKERISQLEEEVSKLDKKVEARESSIVTLQDSLEYILNGTTWAERTIQWKSIVNAVKENVTIL
jgi:predicted nuclease with TOPRIM domain